MKRIRHKPECRDKKARRQKEASDERDADSSQRAGPPLLVPGAAPPIAVGSLLYFPISGGLGVLVTVAFLGRPALCLVVPFWPKTFLCRVSFCGSLSLCLLWL